MKSKRELLKQLLIDESLKVRRLVIFHRREFASERLETSTTTRVVEDLRKHGQGLLKIDFAKNEKARGGDIELWLRGGGFLLGMRLQSKALHGQKKGGGIYKYLHHIIGPDGANPRDQVDVLISGTKPPLFPMYLFYNGLDKKPNVPSGCGSRNGYKKKNGRLGMTVTSAHLVARTWAWGSPGRYLNTVLPHSVPLQCLAACDCPLIEGRDIPLPLRALEWPLSITLARPALILLDPEYEEGDELGGSRAVMVEQLQTRGVEVRAGLVPRYVLDLARDGTLPEGADVNADAVAMIDGDQLGG